ncbi:MAG: hypothetical protein IBX56_15565 [Methylomicrobium sp.]|nr:hypothetical protein [Methylomicrobium sp.]
MQHDRTRVAIARQLKGMGCGLYDVGIRHAERGMLNREWTEAEIIKSLDWLKRENVKGCDIYIRPTRSAARSRLILIDDLSLGTIARLRQGPHSPAVTVQTSPGNFQAWLKLDDDQPADVRREVARYLAREYGGDPNSADSAHYGRLAGFTNRKPQHIDGIGRSPYVLLDSYNGRPALGAIELVRRAVETVEIEREQARSMAAHVKHEARRMPGGGTLTAEALASWYLDLWQGLITHFGDQFDASRADWMAAVAMFGKGCSFQEVAGAICEHSPGIVGRKGASVANYVTRTVGKAEIWHELRTRGAQYTDVADMLLSVAEQRAVERSRKLSE